METKHNMIRSALAQAPGTRLPDGFGTRLMERLHRESARRERRETWLLALAGAGCLALLIAGIVWYFFYDPATGLHLPALPDMPDMPSFSGLSELVKLPEAPEPALPDGSAPQPLFYISIAATFLVLSGLDHFLRRKQRSAAHKKHGTR